MTEVRSFAPRFVGASLLWLGAIVPGAAAVEDAGGFLARSWSGDSRVRVNSPDTPEGPYRDRPEAAATGTLEIESPIDPGTAERAFLYLELWGGHPGTADKAVAVNGGEPIALPEVGTAEEHCVYHYPRVPLPLGDLREGVNRFRFSCTVGSSFWGHYIIDNAALELELPADHPAIAEAGLDGFAASAVAEGVDDRPELLRLRLDVPAEHAESVASASFRGHYRGFDEDGDGEGADWHGFTKGREPTAHLGTIEGPGEAVDWNLSMVPDQDGIRVRALVGFEDRPGLFYRTPPLPGLATPDRPDARVTMHRAADLPRPFWSRDDQVRSCAIPLDRDPEGLGRAQLHVAIWDGGRGTIAEPVTLNGHPLPVAGEGRHDLLYRVVEVDPSFLVRGDNLVRVHSDTEHHGIEVLLPGPALVVRGR